MGVIELSRWGLWHARRGAHTHRLAVPQRWHVDRYDAVAPVLTSMQPSSGRRSEGVCPDEPDETTEVGIGAVALPAVHEATHDLQVARLVVSCAVDPIE